MMNSDVTFFLCLSKWKSNTFLSSSFQNLEKFIFSASLSLLWQREEGFGPIPAEISLAMVHKFNPSHSNTQWRMVETMIFQLLTFYNKNFIFFPSLFQHLCHFSRLREEGMGRVPPETSSALVHKFNPSSNEAQRTTVEAMVYTPGSKSTQLDVCMVLWVSFISFFFNLESLL